MSFELNIVVKTTAILLCVAVLAWMLKRASASVRHGLWALGLFSALAFPVVSNWLPSIELAILPEISSQPAPSTESFERAAAPTNKMLSVLDERPAVAAETDISSAQPPLPAMGEAVSTQVAPVRPVTRATWRRWAALVWALGSAITFFGWFAAWLSLRNLKRKSKLLTDEDWQQLLVEVQREVSVSETVELRIAEDSVPPMTWGILRHVILLPADAVDWSNTRRRLVLGHELAHVKRNDGLGQILAQAVCSVYWFNPIVWYAVHRLHTERERACDDCVLRLGAPAIDYADHLLEIARGLNAGFALTAVSMAHPSELKSRMMAILDSTIRRQVLSRAMSVILLTFILVLTLSTAAIQVTAMAPFVAPHFAGPMPEATGEVAGIPQASADVAIEGKIVDAVTGEPVPDVDILLPQPFTAPSIAATSDSSGRFVIEKLAPGTHELRTDKEGYVSVRPVGRKAPGSEGIWVTLRAGQPLKDLVLRIYKGAAITGRVFDNRGEPVVEAQATLVRPAYDESGRRVMKYLAGAVTDDRGEFRIFGVEAGEYYLRVEPGNDPDAPLAGGFTHERAYYPGVADPSRASLIKLDWGAEVRVGDVTLQTVKAVPVRLKIVNETGVPESGARSFTVYRDGELISGIVGGSTMTGGTGRFELPGLAPGKYDVAVGWGGNDKMSGTRTTLDLTDAEVTGDLVFRKAPVVTGRFLLQQADGTTRPLAASMRLEKHSFQLAARADDQGNFTIPAVPQEEYATRFGRLPPGAFALAIRQDGAEIRADQVRVERDTNLEIVFASEGAVVEGSVTDSKGGKISGALVVLIPDSPLRDHGHLYRTANSDQGGNFVIRGAAPGSYRLFAWSELEGGAYRNAEFMSRFEEQGKAIRIKFGETAKSQIHLADERPAQ